MENYRYKLILSGNLHRMGFRHLALQYARSLGLSGWAGYRSNSIVIEAEGPENLLNSFVDWCRKGPQGCIVQEFEVSEIKPLNSEAFVIYPTHMAVV